MIVNGHLDVVPIEEEASEVWTNDPLKAVVREGRLYGRSANPTATILFATLLTFQII